MKPIFFNVEDISGYIIILLLIMLYINVQEIRLHQSVANNITTLADSALLHLCIDFVLFFLEVGKKPLMTANKVLHSPFSYQIFTMQVKAAIQVCCVQRHLLSAKKEQKHVRQSTFSFLSVNDSCDTKDILYHCQRIRQGFMVFCRAFLKT